MKKILLFLFLILPFFTFSQVPDFIWAKGMGSFSHNVFGNATVVDDSGNVYTAGGFQGTVDFDPGPGIFNLTSSPSGYQDIFILKLNASGNFIWAKSMMGKGDDWASSIAVDGEGYIYLTGAFSDTVDFDPGPGVFNLFSGGYWYVTDIFISKLDRSGNFIWAKSMGAPNSGDEGTAITLDAYGNVYTTGHFYGSVNFDPGPGTFYLTADSGGFSTFILKLDVSGNFIFAKSFGGLGGTYSHSIAVDQSENIYTTGAFNYPVDFDPGMGTYNLAPVPLGNYDVFISKLDSMGNFIWAKQMVGSQSDESTFMLLDEYGNIYTTGYFTDTVDFDPGPGIFNLNANGSYEVFVSKLDNSGNFIWAKAMEGIYGDQGFSIALDASHNIYVAGCYTATCDFDPSAGIFNLTSNGYQDIFISKLDSSGNFIWAKSVGGTDGDAAIAMAVDVSDNLYIVGQFSSPSVSFGATTLANAGGGNNHCDLFISKLSASVTGIQSIEGTNLIYAFPNPATNDITIITNEEKGELILYDFLGKQVMQKPTDHEKQSTLDVSSLSSGIYFLQFKTAKGNFTAKVVRE